MGFIEDINGKINSFVWGPVMLVLIVGVGIYLTVRTGFFQARGFGTWWKNTIATLLRKDRAKTAGHGALTPFQALSTALAATVGTGNVVGVATAIVSGGPGAVFWMWISAFFGMMTKYSEITLALHYRERNEKGEWVGGPMYYISRGLGKNFNWLAALFALFGSLCCFGIGNIAQINSIVSSVESTFANFGLVEVSDGFSAFRLGLGVVLAGLSALVIIGGLKRIGRVTEMLVPVMCVLYILGGLVALTLNAERLPEAFGAIFAGAFSTKAFGGGLLGYVVFRAMRFGIARGVFSNEAGLGSAPIAHAAAEQDVAVKQGFWGIFEVFVDTIIICTFTALIILTSKIDGVLSIHETPLWNGSQLTMKAFEQTFGIGGSVLLSVALSLFAYSTVLSWSLYGQRCFAYLTKGRGVLPFQIVFVAMIVVASVLSLKLVWDVADTLNGLMAIPNLIGLILLSPVVFKLTKEYAESVRAEKRLKA